MNGSSAMRITEACTDPAGSSRPRWTAAGHLSIDGGRAGRIVGIAEIDARSLPTWVSKSRSSPLAHAPAVADAWGTGVVSGREMAMRASTGR